MAEDAIATTVPPEFQLWLAVILVGASVILNFLARYIKGQQDPNDKTKLKRMSPPPKSIGASIGITAITGFVFILPLIPNMAWDMAKEPALTVFGLVSPVLTMSGMDAVIQKIGRIDP